ncbi:NADPH:quinone reductase [Kutzneria kofuensis]|uniref:NADPH2:quinone reductase n=1 Tax=Kutzneria kofuensis TaxID=103725 RepID=A0A7W9KEZ2_9PSEU|nr:NADPH:quinone reductase [Kutzneria kofuensis]MBB5891361.1 NADPH2:quinone reductase [Kutzneria kofuensis]
MRAAWCDRQGPAHEVLRVGELPTPEPAEGEVRVRVAVSGIHVGDLGKRQGWWGSTMAFPRVVPHGDGAGVIDAVGPGVPADRIGERVWVYLAQSYRPFGTAAEYVTVPAGHAVPLPAKVPFEQGAVLGIPGITGHRAIMADGPVDGLRVLVAGPVGAVGRACVAVARRAGATVIGLVRNPADVDTALAAGAHHVVRGDQATGDLIAEIQDLTDGHGVDRIADLAFDSAIATYVELAAYHAVIATYATREPGPSVPFWPLAFKNVTVRFLSNDDFPETANQEAAADLTAALVDGDLRYPVAARFPLDRIADAHDEVTRVGGGGRVVLDLSGHSDV